MVTFRDAVVKIRVEVQERTLRAAKRGLEGLAGVATRVQQAASGASDALKDTAKSSAKLRSEATATKRTLDQTRESARRLSAQQNKLSAESAKLRARQNDLRRELERVRRVANETGDETGKLARQEVRLARELRDTNAALSKNRDQSLLVRASQRALAADVDALSSRFSRLKREAKDAADAENTAFRRFRRGLTPTLPKAEDVGRGIRRGAGRAVRGAARTGLGAAAVGAGAVAVGTVQGLREATQASIEFESAFADVRKVLSDKLDETELEGLRQTIIGLSGELPVTAEGLAQIAAAAGQASIPAEELARFTEFAAKGAVAFDASTDEIGSAAAKLRTGLGLTQDEVESLFGSINELSNNFAATAPQVLDIEKRVGALAKTVGFTAQETAALATALVASGADARVAATGIKNLATRLGAGEAATDKQLGAFEKLGLEATDLAQRLQEDAGAAVVDVFERIASLDKATQAGVLSDLFTRESVGAIGPLLGNLDTLRDALEVAKDETRALSSVQEEFEVRSATTANALQLAKNAAVAFGIQLGDELSPFIAEVAKDFTAFIGDNKELAGVIGKQVVKALRSLLKRVKELIGPPEELGDKVAGLVESLLTLAEAGVTIVEGSSKIIDALGGIGTAVAAMGLAVTAAIGPWGALGVAIGGATLAISKAAVDIIADLAGITDAIERTRQQIRNLERETAKAKQVQEEAEAEVEAVEKRRQQAVERKTTGFTKQLGLKSKEAATGREIVSSAQQAVNAAIEDEIIQLGGFTPDFDVAKARAAASEKAVLRAGTGLDVEAGAEAAREEIRRQSLEQLGVGPEQESARPSGRGGRGRRGGKRKPTPKPVEDKLAGLDPALKAILNAGVEEDALRFSGRGQVTAGITADEQGQFTGLDKGVLASVRASQQSIGQFRGRPRTGATGRGAGPNIIQNITNNNITQNIDARGSEGVVANVARAARDGTERLTGLLFTKQKLNTAGGVRA